MIVLSIRESEGSKSISGRGGGGWERSSLVRRSTVVKLAVCKVRIDG